MQSIDIERSAKRPRSDSQKPLRPPTPFPRGFVDYPLLLTTGDESNMLTTATTMATSNSSASLSADFASPSIQYHPPPQLSEVDDALACLQENVGLLASKLDGPTALELADLVTGPVESIARDVRAIKATHAAGVRHAEENAREQFRAEMMAFLHWSEQ